MEKQIQVEFLERVEVGILLLAWLVRGYEGGAVVILIPMGKKIESCVFQSLFHLYEMCPKTVLFYLLTTQKNLVIFFKNLNGRVC